LRTNKRALRLVWLMHRNRSPWRVSSSSQARRAFTARRPNRRVRHNEARPTCKLRYIALWRHVIEGSSINFAMAFDLYFSMYFLRLYTAIVGRQVLDNQAVHKPEYTIGRPVLRSRRCFQISHPDSFCGYTAVVYCIVSFYTLSI
jgi:hypothetical protein